MIHVSFTDLRKRLAHFMDRAVDDRAPVLITRQGHEPVVMIAQSEYDGMTETLHLLRSPANAARLHEAIADAGRNMIEVEWTSRRGFIGRGEDQLPPPRMGGVSFLAGQ
ncbi:MAG: type II toxin-antitoxin system prevent-host-death family antitoxin [Sphingomonas bacterium]|nr:type II toxin-antitoxin system prevent-host-death family antitoxin [Sphingomonas bacterium]